MIWDFSRRKNKWPKANEQIKNSLHESDALAIVPINSMDEINQ